MADTTIPENALNAFLETLDKANVRAAELFPGDSPRRQPVHTVYGGAHLFTADTTQKLGALALRALDDHAPDATAFAEVFGIDRRLADRVHPRVIEKLTREPVEDLRIDFEDGFGHRPDHEEDGHAVRAANEVAIALSGGTLPRFIGEGGGRIVTAHFGTYDYTAACGITAAHQHMRHPACDFAKHVMQVALAGTGIWLSDGATNVMPIGSREAVHRAWRLHFEHVRHSLVTGFYQGWDLHPAQLPSRYAAVYAFFLEGLGAASERLKQFVAQAAQATLVGHVFDDAATGQGLLNYFLRALNCRAISEQEAIEMSGLTPDELRSRSFVRILQRRTSG